MIQVVWQYIVKKTAVERFIAAYGPGGAWERLFAGYPGYLGTALLRDTEDPLHFVTIDSWEEEGTARSRVASEGGGVVDPDELLDDLTEDEDEVGTFVVASGRPIVQGVSAVRTRKAGQRGGQTRVTNERGMRPSRRTRR